ncbi:TPA: diguanylate cyclase [Candidatus Peregrinibacteria bacterium]|nr:diguanylate cyclase [Candidatus Peregrinibacteria bacterium]
MFICKKIHHCLNSNKKFFREEKVIFMKLENNSENNSEENMSVEEKEFEDAFSKIYGGHNLPVEEKKLALKYKENQELQKQNRFFRDLLNDILTDFHFSKELRIEDFSNADPDSTEYKAYKAYIDLYNEKRKKTLKEIEILITELKESKSENLVFKKRIRELIERIRGLLLEKAITESEKNFTIGKIRKLEDKLGENQLTGLPTERILKEKLEKIPYDNKKSIKVCYMDLTNFKNVNTVLGYGNADKVLQIYGKALKEAIPIFEGENKKITPYHPHGDEFALMFENITDKEIVEYARAVEKIAQGEIKNFEKKLQIEKDEDGETVLLDDDEIYTHLSFGVMDFLPSYTVENIISRSNKLLDAVKCFKKGDIIKNNSEKDGCDIYSGFCNSTIGYEKYKTKEEVYMLIKRAREKLKAAEIKAQNRRKEDKQKMKERTQEWKRDYSEYINLPKILKKSLVNNEISDNFSDELKELQRKNAGDHNNRISIVENYLNRTLTQSQKKIIEIVYKFPQTSLYEIIGKRDFLLNHGFSKKEVKILLRSGLVGVREENIMEKK